MSENTKKPHDVTIAKAKGRPMLTWVGKKPLARVIAYPAQAIEQFSAQPQGTAKPQGETDWSDWPKDMPQGGLLYHGDNKDVLAHLLANGFRGKVKLIYIDPPFDSGADYVRKVQLRGAKGTVKIEGEEYALGEQVQYGDIWANDNYLQFMYERLLMLRELLSEDGSIYLHCDHARSHVLRCLLDEVFGSDNFLGEIIWAFRERSISKTYWNRKHNAILYYKKGASHTFNVNDVREEYADEYIAKFKYEDEEGKYQIRGRNIPGSPVKQADGLNPEHEKKFPGLTYRQYFHDGGQLPVDWWKIPYAEEDEVDGDLWEIPLLNKAAKERMGYPTQKPEALIERIIRASSNSGDLVFDCFIGGGTTAAVSQKLGRRWIGCDINKGAIQTTAKRLQNLMHDQSATLSNARQSELVATENAQPKTCQLSFTTWRVNDYDLQIQHNEAVELASQHLGVTRTRTDPYFDGLQGERLVKIIPFNHPLTPLDLEALRTELKNRPNEERDIMLVSLGIEHSARKWVEDYNRNRPVNKLHLIELRTDRKYGGIIKHEPISTDITIRREGDNLLVEIIDVVSPTIIQRLNLEKGVFRAQIADWRAVVDCVLIDTQYNGEVFNVALSNVPERKQDLVNGRYELPIPPTGSTVAIKIIDMLGEEIIWTGQVN
jgi:DNA modification methylase